MKKIENAAAQGDLMIRRVQALPEGLKEEAPVGGRLTVGHSETGHHHTVEARLGIRLFRSEQPLISFLVVEGDEGVELTHQRSFDTHAPVGIPAGIFEIRHQQEFSPEGWRAVSD